MIRMRRIPTMITAVHTKSCYFRYELLLFLVIVFHATLLQGQINTFQRAYYQSQSNFGTCVKELSDSSYIVGGRRYGTPLMQTHLWHLNKQGDIKNVFSLCGGGVIGMITDKDDRIKITGASTACNGSGGDVFLTELDTTGNITFSHLFGTSGIDRGEDLIQIDSIRYILACYNNPNPDLYCVDTSGTVIWSQSYGLSGLYRIKRNLEGGYFICGNAGGGFVDPMYVAKIDSLGNVIWYKTFYNPNSEIFTDIEPTPDSGVIAVTDFNGLYKISATGDSVWKKTMNGPSQRLITNSDGDILIIGGGMRLTKVDTSGTILWSYTYWIYPVVVGVLSYDGWDVIQTSDGGYLLVGEIDSLGTKNLYVVKTDSLGQVTTGLSEINPSAQTQCYPQPFTEETIITFTAADGLPISGNHTLEIFTSLGQKVREETISAFPYHFHRNRLPSGLYVYTITHPGEIPVTGKMVVE